MNLGQLCTEVGQSMTSDDPSRVKLWVNAANDEINARDDWSWLVVTSPFITLVDSQDTYSLVGPSALVQDFGGIINVLLELGDPGSQRLPLKEMEVADFDYFSGMSRDAGTPVLFTIAGATATTGSDDIVSGGGADLVIWPPPTADAGKGKSIYVRYYRSVKSVQMVADTDEPIIPTQHHYAIIELAKSYALTDDDQVPQAQQFRQQAEARIAAMQIEDQRMRRYQRQIWKLTLSDQNPPLPQPSK